MNRNIINDKVAFNPLADAEGDDEEEKNPLGDVELEKVTVNEEEALLETASAPSEQPTFVNECQVEEEKRKEPVTVIESDNPLADIEGPLPLSDKTDGSKACDPASVSDPFGGGEPAKVGDGLISEEDLLTGPAHNLDDSQYKADYVDPNLEDIFK